MTSVLVTGAAGFIGSNFVRRCLLHGFLVTGVDDLSNGHVEFLPAPMREGHGFYACDFTDAKILNKVLDGEFDYVVHLAAVPRVGYSVEHPYYTNDVNVSKTLRLLDVCRTSGNVKHIKRFIFASSSSVYGGADVSVGPTHESSKKNPKSPYALQKSIIEDYLALYSDLYDLDSACLRFFNVFGPRQLGDSPYATAVSAWLSAIKRGVPMRSDGDGSQSRDMCYVDNVTNACMLAISAQGRIDGRCYNIACGESTTNNQVMDYLIKRYPNATKVDAPWRKGDVMHTHADITRACEELSYTPSVNVWEGIERTIDWVERTPEFVSLLLKV